MREEPKAGAGDPASLPDDEDDVDLAAATEKGSAVGSTPLGAGSRAAAEEPQPGAELTSPPSGQGDGLEGVGKAAVFVLSLDEELASLVLRHLSDVELSRIAAEISRLGVVDNEKVASVLAEYRDLEQVHGLVRRGGADQAVRILEGSFSRDRARRIIEMIGMERRDAPFAFLEAVEIETLMAVLGEEHPQTLAVILVHLSPEKAAEILRHLSPESRREVLGRIAALEGTNAEALEEVELMLEKHLMGARYEPLGDAGGARAVAEILRAVGSDTPYLDELRQEQPELAEEIDRHLFLFEDMTRLDDRSLQLVLKEVEPRQLALALKGASDAVRSKVLDNLSRRAAEAMRETLELLGPLRAGEVQNAQRSIIRTVLALEGAGHIAVPASRREPTRSLS